LAQAADQDRRERFLDTSQCAFLALLVSTPRDAAEVLCRNQHRWESCLLKERGFHVGSRTPVGRRTPTAR
jgi:hypothetical protein